MKVSIRGVIIAAAVAPSVTMGLTMILLWAFEAVPYAISMGGAPAVTKELMGYTSLQTELWGSFGRLLFDFILGPLVAIPLGFVGAAIFLIPAFALASVRDDVRYYMIAGGLAGAIHAALGILMSPILENSAGWLSLILGFLPYGFRPALTITAAISAPVAGILAGYLYGRTIALGRSVPSALA